MGRVTITVKTGDITSHNVDLIINSSNWYLILGGGTAKQIRNAGGIIRSGREISNYLRMVDRTEGQLRASLEYFHSKNPRPSIVQRECLSYMVRKNMPNGLALGDAVITATGNLSQTPSRASHVVHAVGMGYTFDGQNFHTVPATSDSVKDSLSKSFAIANNMNCRVIAVPVMCTRKGGLTKCESMDAFTEALGKAGHIKMEEIILALYSPELEKEGAWFKNYVDRNL